MLGGDEKGGDDAPIKGRPDVVSACIASAVDETTDDSVQCLRYVETGIAGLASDVTDARLELIQESQSFIGICAYKLDTACEEGERIVEALTQRCQRATDEKTPYTIRILLNRRGLPVTLVKPNVADGIEDTIAMLKVRFPALEIEHRYHVTNTRDSLHQKLWVADIVGDSQLRILICSGDVWAPSARDQHRREISVADEGELAVAGLTLFNTFWCQQGAATDLVCMDFAGGASAAATTASAVSGGAVGGAGVHDRGGSVGGAGAATTSGKTEPSAGQAILLSKVGRGAFSIPTHKEALAVVALLAAIQNTAADETISIIVSSINNPAVIDALADACNRGVLVRLFANKWHNYGNLKKYGGGDTNDVSFDKLYEKVDAKKRYCLQVRWAVYEAGEHEKALILEGDEHYNVHAKAALFSWGAVLVGSSAYDEQALYSQELDVVYFGRDFYQKCLARVFTPHFNHGRDCVIDLVVARLEAASPLRAQLIDICYSAEEVREQRVAALTACAEDKATDKDSLRVFINLLRTTIAPLEMVEFSCASPVGDALHTAAHADADATHGAAAAVTAD